MEFIYIFLGLMVVIIVIEFGVKPFVKNKEIDSLLNDISLVHNLTVKKVKHNDYHYVLEDEDNIYYIRVLEVSSPACVTVNCKTTWSLTWGGAKNNPGKRYPNQRYVNELIEFLKDEYQSSKKIIKIVLLYKECEKILKYINESELKEVTIKEDAYGIKALNYTNFKESFEELKKGVR